MGDFVFRKNEQSNAWTILAPRRSKRTNVGKKAEPICPFCIGTEGDEPELYRVGGQAGDSNWHIRVIPNKFPFTPHHEIIIHSPDHHKNIDELPFPQVELILQTYRHRYRANVSKGQVYLFHNRGIAAGESLPHPHTQLTLVPDDVTLAIPPLDMKIYESRISQESGKKNKKTFSMILNSLFMIHKEKISLKQETVVDTRSLLETEDFLIFCPQTSSWPDEVWVAPKKSGETFGDVSDSALTDLSFVLARIIQLFDLRHGYEFPFNFYIAPGKNWYLRFIPRMRILGGFEVGTQVLVNTQDPTETFAFVKEHFWEPNVEKIKSEQRADYWKSV